MSDTPPPLPVAEETPSLTVEAVRVGPPPAPMFWRSLAILLDTILLGLLGWLITTHVLIPAFKAEELEVFNGWISEMEKGFSSVQAAAERFNAGGSFAAYEREAKSFFDKLADTPAGVRDLAYFTSWSMTMVYWIGFAGMEIAMRGGSLGKSMFKLRTASFPHCERPRFFDSVVRSGWKAMCVGSPSLLIALFAVVDAHWPLFNPLRRSLHDLMARTLVIDARFEPEDKKDKEEKKPSDEPDAE